MPDLLRGISYTARQRFQQALKIYEARYGPWHDVVASTLSQLARADASLGDYAAARREQSRAVTIHERVGGPNHPYVAIALMDLASVYRDAGSPIQALPLLKRALAIREKSLGPNHREVAWTPGGPGVHADAGRRDDTGTDRSYTCGRYLGATRHTRRT